MAVKKIGQWAKFRALLHPVKFSQRLKVEVGKATGQNAAYIVKKARRTISKNHFAQNANLTALIKGQNKALVDTSALWDSIWFVQVSWGHAFVGVLRSNDRFNVAEVVHEGAKIPVTNKMRMMFLYLHWVSTGHAGPEELTGRAKELWERNPGMIWYPLRAATKAISIPSRPFMKVVFDDPKTLAAVMLNWERAVGRALL